MTSTRRRRAARCAVPRRPELGLAAAVADRAAPRPLSLLHPVRAPSHERRRDAAHRSRDGAVPALLRAAGPARHRRRLPALRVRGAARDPHARVAAREVRASRGEDLGTVPTPCGPAMDAPRPVSPARRPVVLPEPGRAAAEHVAGGGGREPQHARHGDVRRLVARRRHRRQARPRPRRPRAGARRAAPSARRRRPRCSRSRARSSRAIR